MTASSDPAPVTSPDNSGSPPRPPRRSGNLRWILGIGGGAIGGVFVGISIYDVFPIGIFLFLAIGIVVGVVVPSAGGLAGLGAIATLIVASLSENQTNFAFLPLAGCCLGFVWSIATWTWRRNHPRQLPHFDEGTVAAVRQDRIRLGQASLIAGLVLGLGFGLLFGGPILIAGPLFGLLVGGIMFIGLVLSAKISNGRK